MLLHVKVAIRPCGAGRWHMLRCAAQIGHLPLPEGLQLLFTSTCDHMCNTSRFVSSRLVFLACDGLVWLGLQCNKLHFKMFVVATFFSVRLTAALVEAMYFYPTNRVSVSVTVESVELLCAKPIETKTNPSQHITHHQQYAHERLTGLIIRINGDVTCVGRNTLTLLTPIFG